VDAFCELGTLIEFTPLFVDRGHILMKLDRNV